VPQARTAYCGLMSAWNACDHVWRAKIDSQSHSENRTEVFCVKCHCPGERDYKTGDVFWPTT
jgi:hypothetical protein